MVGLVTPTLSHPVLPAIFNDNNNVNNNVVIIIIIMQVKSCTSKGLPSGESTRPTTERRVNYNYQLLAVMLQK